MDGHCLANFRLVCQPINLRKSSAQELEMLGRLVTISTFINPIYCKEVLPSKWNHSVPGQ